MPRGVITPLMRVGVLVFGSDGALCITIVGVGCVSVSDSLTTITTFTETPSHIIQGGNVPNK